MIKYIGVLSITPSEVYASKNEEKSKKKKQNKRPYCHKLQRRKIGFIITLYYKVIINAR